MSHDKDRVVLNVGGQKYETRKSTFAIYPKTLLGRMFAPENEQLLRCDPDGSIFFDRDGVLFQHILNFYRTGRLFVDEDCCENDSVLRRQLVDEYEFWLIKPCDARELIEPKIEEKSEAWKILMLRRGFDPEKPFLATIWLTGVDKYFSNQVHSFASNNSSNEWRCLFLLTDETGIYLDAYVKSSCGVCCFIPWRKGSVACENTHTVFELEILHRNQFSTSTVERLCLQSGNYSIERFKDNVVRTQVGEAKVVSRTDAEVFDAVNMTSLCRVQRQDIVALNDSFSLNNDLQGYFDVTQSWLRFHFHDSISVCETAICFNEWTANVNKKSLSSALRLIASLRERADYVDIWRTADKKKIVFTAAEPINGAQIYCYTRCNIERNLMF